jgi:hypothetical protein
MTENSDSLNDTLRTLEPGPWSAPDHQQRVEKELLHSHGRLARQTLFARHRTVIIGLLLLVMAGGIGGATYSWYTKANQYTLQVRLGGEVIGGARVTVHRGQTASISVDGGETAPPFAVTIHYDGTATIEGPRGIEFDMEVVEVDVSRE